MVSPGSTTIGAISYRRLLDGTKAYVPELAHMSVKAYGESHGLEAALGALARATILLRAVLIFGWNDLFVRFARRVARLVNSSAIFIRLLASIAAPTDIRSARGLGRGNAAAAHQYRDRPSMPARKRWPSLNVRDRS
jgi:hypothetical protein